MVLNLVVSNIIRTIVLTLKTNNMKNSITLLLLTISLTVSAQWSSHVKNDEFKGKLSYSIAQGTGGDFPYEEPRMVIRKVYKINDKDYDKYSAYISDAGSTYCDSTLEVSFVFDSDRSTMVTTRMTPSLDNEAGFFDLSEDLVNKIKKHSYMYVRFRTGCSQNIFRVSLRGSTSSLAKIGL